MPLGNPDDLAHYTHFQVFGARQANRLQPQFSRAAAFVHMDMGRFRAFFGIEVERTARFSVNCRHERTIPADSGMCKSSLQAIRCCVFNLSHRAGMNRSGMMMLQLMATFAHMIFPHRF